MAPDDVARQFSDRLDLRVGEIAVAKLVTGIMHFDADRVRVDVADPPPLGNPGMPGAGAFIDHLGDAALVIDEIVA